tara:strand:+ start:2078 stop:2998 length:921 start_codon:yes stop_codon:yes gene_type:complete
MSSKQNWIKKGNIFNKHHAQVPVVDIDNDGYWRIYYSTRDDRGRSRAMYIDVEPGNPSKILNESQEPVLELGKLGTFDVSGTMPTCLVTTNKDLKLLYYIGWTRRLDVPYQNSIGLAISDDGGNTFNKYSEGPILGPDKDEPYFTGTINVIFDTETFIWKAWYLSTIKWEELNGIVEPFYVIRHAYSLDGINWVKKNISIDLNENEGGISQASVIKEDDIYKMWYSYRGETDYRLNVDNSYRIGYAESKDGLEWNRMDDKIGMGVSKEGWDSTMICYPNVINYNDKKIMFYNGNGFGNTGIGYAEL